jgi:peptide deformylase
MLKIENSKMAKLECLPIDNITTAKKILDPKTLEQMFNILKRKDGVGLAAPQVGIRYKFFLAFMPQLDSWRVFLNPRYEKTGDEIEFVEECLTVKGKPYKVKRSNKVKAFWSEYIPDIDAFDHFETDLVEEMSAIIFQHEADHCNGILISDHGEEINKDDEISEETDELTVREILEKRRNGDS